MTEETGDEAARPIREIDEYPLPPGLDGYPILGSLPQVLRDPFGIFDTLAEYGDVVRYSVLGFPFTALLHPDHIERVLVTEHERFDRNLFSDFGFDFAPEGLILTDGEQWRKQRQLLQPAFSITHIHSYADTMAGYAERTGETWIDGQEIALNRALSDLTLQILSKTLFGITVDPSEDDEAITRAAQLISERVDVQRLTTFLPTWVPTRANRQYNRAMREYRVRIDELIDRRREQNTDADDLLSILLHAEGTDGYTLSEAEVRDNLLTFMFAGHETSSLGLTYTFMLLAQHDSVEKRLQRELETVLGGETPTIEQLQQLPYTENVIKEALRLHPPSHLLIRRATEDVLIDGYRIPEGTLLMLPQFWLHTDERFYDAPEEFKPGRWTDEFEDELPEYAYFPFGGGPRHCIGMRFAMLEMKLVATTLAQQFDFELLSDPDPEISGGAAHRPKEDVRVRVHRR